MKNPGAYAARLTWILVDVSLFVRPLQCLDLHLIRQIRGQYLPVLRTPLDCNISITPN